jgi:hypothetical protein
MPVVVPVAATAVLLLAHVPPPGASVSSAVVPTHSPVAPLISPGPGFTVNVVVA